MNKKKSKREYLCVVDEHGRFIREEERETCHLGRGLLHSAFLVMVFNDKNELMIARRSKKKKLWPCFWDGTVASHCYKDEDIQVTMAKRLYEEIGTGNDDLEYLFNFRYQAQYKSVGSENEICDVYRTDNINTKDISISPSEISEFRFVGLSRLKEATQRTGYDYAPWFVLALEKFFIASL